MSNEWQNAITKVLIWEEYMRQRNAIISNRRLSIRSAISALQFSESDKIQGSEWTVRYVSIIPMRFPLR